MKKLLSMVAALALFLALAAPAFADDSISSVQYVPSESITVDSAVAVESEETMTIESDGGEIVVEVQVSEAEMTEDEEASLLETVNSDVVTDAVEEAIANGDLPEGSTASAVEVVDVDLYYAIHYEAELVGETISDEHYEDWFDTHETLTVSFVRNDVDQKVVTVLYYDEENNKWDEAENVHYDENGNLLATFRHLCTVAFVLTDVESTVTPDDSGKTDDDTTSSSGSTSTNPATSPQTGYDTAGWTAAIVVLLLGAGYCFVSARKKTEE